MEVPLAEPNLKILMVTSEVVPFAKAGGLGDMVAALSSELARQGHDVRIVLPRYYSVDVGRLQRVGGPLGVPLGTHWRLNEHPSRTKLHLKRSSAIALAFVVL